MPGGRETGADGAGGWPRGSGEMARRIRRHDWAATSLGPIEDWPQSLRFAVETMLAMGFPAILMWGPDRVVAGYNDAYIPLLGKKPEALGQRFLDVWSEAAPFVEPSIQRAEAGETIRVEGAEFRLARHDRLESATFDYCFSPLRDEAGAIAGVLNSGSETTERVQAERRLRAAQEVGRVGTFEWNIPDDVNTWSREIEHLYGLEEGDFDGTYEDWAARVHPDDLPAAEERVREALRTGRLQAEWRALRPDGQVVWVEARGRVERNAAGEPLRMIGTNFDVSARRAAEEALKASESRAKRLLEELQHRVRNTLAVVRSIARRTGEASDTVEHCSMHLDGRIGAFARIQSAILRSPTGAVDLATLIADELVAAAAQEGERVRLEGPDIALRPHAAETLGLAIHELTTNAVKFGALADASGALRVAWRIDDAEGPAKLLLDWKERRANCLESASGHRGFGTEVLERTLPYELGAEVIPSFEDDGFRCVVKLPLIENIMTQAAA